LPFYAILRSIPGKISGVSAMGGAIVVLFFLPFLNSSNVRSSTFRPIYGASFWFILFDFVFLGWIGQAPIRYPFTFIGKVATFFYFFYFLFFFSYVGQLEEQLSRTLYVAEE
jgi:ubiquinol-cytochrome c reductase cytochrome b subunit